jgi:hypothetical protein
MRIDATGLTHVQRDADAVRLNPAGRGESSPHAHAKLDRLGIWFSGVCAVHCMVMPIVLISFPVVTWIHWSRIMDAVVLGLAAVFGLGGCLLSLRRHRDPYPLLLVLAGLLLNATGRFGATRLGPWLAQTLVIAGPLTMAFGLWRDRQLCRCNRQAR